MLRNTAAVRALLKEFADSDYIRSKFASEMSNMYKTEVPLYGKLMELVADVNADVLAKDPALKATMVRNDDMERLDVERHGAIRLGTPEELYNIRRVFNVMGMKPVGYYDLSVAGVPVHSTCFRPLDANSLKVNPFRVFTSLLRLDLISDEALRKETEEILSRRNIFTPAALELATKFEKDGGLAPQDAETFVKEALETFRWHSEATVSKETYKKLHDAHRLIADIVCFKGPHINHLTPRTLDIDAVQEAMIKAGIDAKEVVEGPPRRKCPILLRQTSFKALNEEVKFPAGEGKAVSGTHTARFGEIEQRGLALTAKGRKMYDEMLESVRSAENCAGSTDANYYTRLADAFKSFPDEYEQLRNEKLGFFRYKLVDDIDCDALKEQFTQNPDTDENDMVNRGFATADPIIYEDFLPVSAAGIFQSNLGGCEQRAYESRSNKAMFEEALGAAVSELEDVYGAIQKESIDAMWTRIEHKKEKIPERTLSEEKQRNL